jgi:hypothetical protein
MTTVACLRAAPRSVVTFVVRTSCTVVTFLVRLVATLAGMKRAGSGASMWAPAGARW